MDSLKGLFAGKKGFSYIELIVGMTILLIGVGFFVSSYGISNRNKLLARERTSMATVAQNVAEVYLAAGGDHNTRSAKALTVYSNDYSVGITTNPPIVTGYSNLMIITVTVNPSPNHTNIISTPYVLEFYAWKKQ